jgi:hypothetical protein
VAQLDSREKFRDDNKGKTNKNRPDDVAFQDKTQCHIKILGNVRFRPDLFLPISCINEDGVLDRFPSQETTRLSITMSEKFGANGMISNMKSTHALWPMNGATSPLAQATKFMVR